MKCVLISINPEQCKLIASSKKTIEVRKTKPKIDTPFKCYIYCTKDKIDTSPKTKWWKANSTGRRHVMNGKVIGEFVCTKICPIIERDIFLGMDDTHDCFLEEKTYMSCEELVSYLGNSKIMYAWYISELKIYDERKELKKFGKFECEYCSSEKECFAPELISDCSFRRVNINTNHKTMWICDYDFIPLTRPPQSWCYVGEI